MIVTSDGGSKEGDDDAGSTTLRFLREPLPLLLPPTLLLLDPTTSMRALADASTAGLSIAEDSSDGCCNSCGGGGCCCDEGGTKPPAEPLDTNRADGGGMKPTAESLDPVRTSEAAGAEDVSPDIRAGPASRSGAITEAVAPSSVWLTLAFGGSSWGRKERLRFLLGFFDAEPPSVAPSSDALLRAALPWGRGVASSTTTANGAMPREAIGAARGTSNCCCCCCWFAAGACCWSRGGEGSAASGVAVAVATTAATAEGATVEDELGVPLPLDFLLKLPSGACWCDGIALPVAWLRNKSMLMSPPALPPNSAPNRDDTGTLGAGTTLIRLDAVLPGLVTSEGRLLPPLLPAETFRTKGTNGSRIGRADPMLSEEASDAASSLLLSCSLGGGLKPPSSSKKERSMLERGVWVLGGVFGFGADSADVLILLLIVLHPSVSAQEARNPRVHPVH